MSGVGFNWDLAYVQDARTDDVAIIGCCQEM